jgi:PKD repeat protein
VGTYEATLYVWSSTGQMARASIPITVLNTPPNASADVTPSNGAVPLTVSLVGTGSDPDGQIVLYEWDFEGDGTYDWSSTGTGTTTHTYTSKGTFAAVFRVTDNSGQTATAVAVTTTVRIGPPGSPTATASASPASGNAPLTVSFSGTGMDPDGNIVSYEWDFDNDGVFDYSSPTSGSTSHTYTRGGTQVATFRVTDEQGLTGTDQVLTTVHIQTSLSVSPNTVGFLDGALDQPVEPAGTTITTTLSADTQVSVWIQDAGGNLVRTLVSNAGRALGTYQDYWDTRDDNGVMVNDGLYYAMMQYLVDGEPKILDLTYTTGGARSSFPFGSGCNRRANFSRSISPFDDDFLELAFTLCSAQEVTMFIGPLWTGGDVTRVRTIANRQPFPAGTHTIYWDGLDDDGNVAVAPPGDSLITGAWRYSQPNNAIHMTGGRPVIGAVAAEPNYFSPFSEKCDAEGRSEGITLSYGVSEAAATVELRVYSVDTGALVRRTLVANVPAGDNTLFWDAKNNAGEYVDIGEYQVGVMATDAEGNQSMLRYTLVRVDY